MYEKESTLWPFNICTFSHKWCECRQPWRLYAINIRLDWFSQVRMTNLWTRQARLPTRSRVSCYKTFSLRKSIQSEVNCAHFGIFSTIYVAEKQLSHAKYFIHVAATIEVTANESSRSSVLWIRAKQSQLNMLYRVTILGVIHRNIVSVNFRLACFRATSNF